jgi:hypothetical protein
MPTFTTGERVLVAFDLARGTLATGSPDVPPRGAAGPVREAEIVMVLPVQTQGQGQGYERQYLVRFDDGQQSLVWEGELYPITPLHAAEQPADDDDGAREGEQQPHPARRSS